MQLHDACSMSLHTQCQTLLGPLIKDVCRCIAGRTALSQKILTGRYHAPEHMSEHMQDLIACMLDLDPASRITFPQICTHRWVTGSLAAGSVSARLPPPLLRRMPADGTHSGGAKGDQSADGCADDAQVAQRPYLFDAAILNHMQKLEVQRQTVAVHVSANACNHITATYYLLAEAKRAAQAVPGVTAHSVALGSALAQHTERMGRMHGFSLDESEHSDRDDAAFFAPKSSRVASG